MTRTVFFFVTASTSPSSLAADDTGGSGSSGSSVRFGVALRAGSISQTRARPSLRDRVASRPFAAKKTRCTGPVWPRSTMIWRPLPATQSRTVPSMLVVAKRSPPGLKARPRRPLE